MFHYHFSTIVPTRCAFQYNRIQSKHVLKYACLWTHYSDPTPPHPALPRPTPPPPYPSPALAVLHPAVEREQGSVQSVVEERYALFGE